MSVSSSNFSICGSELTPQICVLTGISGAFHPGNTREYLCGNGRQVAGLLDPLKRTVKVRSLQ